jgi:hypothetical protein
VVTSCFSKIRMDLIHEASRYLQSDKLTERQKGKKLLDTIRSQHPAFLSSESWLILNPAIIEYECKEIQQAQKKRLRALDEEVAQFMKRHFVHAVVHNIERPKGCVDYFRHALTILQSEDPIVSAGYKRKHKEIICAVLSQDIVLKLPSKFFIKLLDLLQRELTSEKRIADPVNIKLLNLFCVSLRSDESRANGIVHETLQWIDTAIVPAIDSMQNLEASIVTSLGEGICALVVYEPISEIFSAFQVVVKVFSSTTRVMVNSNVRIKESCQSILMRFVDYFLGLMSVFDVQLAAVDTFLYLVGNCEEYCLSDAVLLSLFNAVEASGKKPSSLELEIGRISATCAFTVKICFFRHQLTVRSEEANLIMARNCFESVLIKMNKSLLYKPSSELYSSKKQLLTTEIQLQSALVCTLLSFLHVFKNGECFASRNSRMMQSNEDVFVESVEEIIQMTAKAFALPWLPSLLNLKSYFLIVVSNVLSVTANMCSCGHLRLTMEVILKLNVLVSQLIDLKVMHQIIGREMDVLCLTTIVSRAHHIGLLDGPLGSSVCGQLWKLFSTRDPNVPNSVLCIPLLVSACAYVHDAGSVHANAVFGGTNSFNSSFSGEEDFEKTAAVAVSLPAGSTVCRVMHFVVVWMHAMLERSRIVGLGLRWDEVMPRLFAAFRGLFVKENSGNQRIHCSQDRPVHLASLLLDTQFVLDPLAARGAVTEESFQACRLNVEEAMCLEVLFVQLADKVSNQVDQQDPQDMRPASSSFSQRIQSNVDSSDLFCTSLLACQLIAVFLVHCSENDIPLSSELKLRLNRIVPTLTGKLCNNFVGKVQTPEIIESLGRVVENLSLVTGSSAATSSKSRSSSSTMSTGIQQQLLQLIAALTRSLRPARANEFADDVLQPRGVKRSAAALDDDDDDFMGDFAHRAGSSPKSPGGSGGSISSFSLIISIVECYLRCDLQELQQEKLSSQLQLNEIGADPKFLGSLIVRLMEFPVTDVFLPLFQALKRSSASSSTQYMQSLKIAGAVLRGDGKINTARAGEIVGICLEILLAREHVYQELHKSFWWVRVQQLLSVVAADINLLRMDPAIVEVVKELFIGAFDDRDIRVKMAGALCSDVLLNFSSSHTRLFSVVRESLSIHGVIAASDSETWILSTYCAGTAKLGGASMEVLAASIKEIVKIATLNRGNPGSVTPSWKRLLNRHLEYLCVQHKYSSVTSLMADHAQPLIKDYLVLEPTAGSQQIPFQQFPVHLLCGAAESVSTTALFRAIQPKVLPEIACIEDDTLRLQLLTGFLALCGSRSSDREIGAVALGNMASLTANIVFRSMLESNNDGEITSQAHLMESFVRRVTNSSVLLSTDAGSCAKCIYCLFELLSTGMQADPSASTQLTTESIKQSIHRICSDCGVAATSPAILQSCNMIDIVSLLRRRFNETRMPIVRRNIVCGLSAIVWFASDAVNICALRNSISVVCNLAISDVAPNADLMTESLVAAMKGLSTALCREEDSVTQVRPSTPSGRPPTPLLLPSASKKELSLACLEIVSYLTNMFQFAKLDQNSVREDDILAKVARTIKSKRFSADLVASAVTAVGEYMETVLMMAGGGVVSKVLVPSWCQVAALNTSESWYRLKNENVSAESLLLLIKTVSSIIEVFVGNFGIGHLFLWNQVLVHASLATLQ